MKTQSSHQPPSLMQEAFSWEVGLILRVGGTVCQIDEVHLTDGHLILRHFQSNQKKRVEISKLNGLLGMGELSLLNKPDSREGMIELLTRSDIERTQLAALPLDGKSRAQMRETLLRIKWLNALHRNGYQNFRPCELPRLEIIRIAAKDSLPTRNARTLAQWEQTASNGKQSLIPEYGARGGAGGTRTDRRFEDILGATIAAAKKGDVDLDIPSVYSKTWTDVARHNATVGTGAIVPMGSMSTVARRFAQAITPFERDVAKHGAKRAKILHKATEARPKLELPVGITEFDDLDTKVFCIDERTGLGWGRPWITVGIDQSSGFPVGRSFDTQPRSAVSAVNALVHSIGPKQVIATINGRPLEWEAYGYPTQVLFDNAVYNSPRIVSLDADVADPGWARPFTPTDKRQIEYFNGRTIHDFCRRLKGWRGALDDPEALKQGLKTAILPFRELFTLHEKWMLGKYANQPMRDGLTPRQKYLEEGQLSLRAKLPPDIRRLNLLRMLTFPKPIVWSRNGIRVMGLTFQEENLYKRFIRRDGGSMKVDARMDPEDLTSLFVTIPDSSIVLVIPCLEQRYVEGLTLYQQRLIMNMCAAKKRRNPSLAAMHQTREELRLATRQWCESGKVRLRRKAVRVGELPQVTTKNSDNTQAVAIHDLEAAYDELDAVEMAEGDEGWTLPSF